MAMCDRDWYQGAYHERRNATLPQNRNGELRNRKTPIPDLHWKLLAIGIAALSVFLLCRWSLERGDDPFHLVRPPALSGTITSPVVTKSAITGVHRTITLPPALMRAPEWGDQRTARAVELTIFPSQSAVFFAPGYINGHEVLFAVDVRSSAVVIPDRLRQKLGLSRGRYLATRTASEIVGGYETRIQSLSIGPIRLQNVSGELNPTVGDDSVLLGMSALKALEVSRASNRLIIRQQLASRDALQAAPRDSYSPVPRFKRHVADCVGPDRVVDADVIACMERE